MKSNLDWFFNKASKWQQEYAMLRDIVLEFGLMEDCKWMHPCYLDKGKNIVLIHGFKDYCALLFFKGALSKDRYGLLVQQTKNVQDRRQLRFASLEEILDSRETIKEYIKEAIEIEKSGLKVTFKKTSDFEVAEEFQNLLNEMPEVKKAFYDLTPGRQKGYLLYFSAAKQVITREARIEKCVPEILKGKGLDAKN